MAKSNLLLVYQRARNAAAGIAGVAAVLGLTVSSLDARFAQADDCAACDKYLAFLPEYSLAREAAAIGTAALHPEGRALSEPADEGEELRREIENDERIPENCRAYVASKVRLNARVALTATGTYGGVPTAFSMSSGYPDGLMSMFNALAASYNPCASLRSGPQQQYVGCLWNNAPAAFQSFSNDLQSNSTSQLTGALAALGYSAAPNDVALLRAFGAAINSGSAAGLMSWAQTASKQLGTQGFLTEVQMMGWEMNNMYNNPRNEGLGTAGQGIVTVDQALASMQNGAMYLIQSSGDPAASLGDYAVVCRDAAVVQAQILRAAGFPNSYTVAYRTQNDGHVDVITQDPHDPTVLYGLNWDGLAKHTGLDGSQALFQASGSGLPDYSTTYYISDPSGKGVGTVQSEMGKFLTEAAGGNIQYWDPAARSHSSIVAISLSPDSGGAFSARAIYGTDGNGASYSGAAADVRWGSGSRFPGQLGIFVGQQFRPADVYQTSANGTTAIAYAQIDQHALSPQIKLGDGVSAVLDGRATLGGALTLATSGPDYSPTGGIMPNFGGDGDQRFGSELRIEQKKRLGDDPAAPEIDARYVAGGTLVVGPSDVRNEAPSSMMLLPMHGYVGANATLKTGDVSIIGQSLLVVDQMGARDQIELGVATRSLAATVNESGRVTNGTALIEDGSIRRVGASLSASVSPHLRLSLTGEIPLEGAGRLQSARAYGTAAVLF